jgi:hypothetical protein
MTERTTMKINSKEFCVQPGEKVNLEKRETLAAPVYQSKKDYKKS